MYEYVITTTALTTIILLIVAWAFRKSIETFLISNSQHYFDKRLETLKSELASQKERELAELRANFDEKLEVHRLALGTYTHGQQLIHERRLFAIERVWNDVLRIKQFAPKAMIFGDILTVDESHHLGLIKLPDGSGISEISDELDKLDKDIEQARLYISEYLWALCFAFKAINLRIGFLISQNQSGASTERWQDDSAIDGLLKSAMSSGEYNRYNQLEIGKLTFIRNVLESKILNSMNMIVTGEELSAELMAQSVRISNIAEKIQSELIQKEIKSNAQG